MSLRTRLLFLVFLVPPFLAACNGSGGPGASTEVSTDSAQQIGDLMASVDEAGGSTGSLALLRSAEREYARAFPASHFERLWTSLILPPATAVSCRLANTYSACQANVVTRDFNGCTIGGAVLDGTITLTWTDSAVNDTCQMTANGHRISRLPDFSISGSQGGRVTVTASGNGQAIERTSSTTYSFTSDSIRRAVTFQGSTIADYSTETTSALTITGAARSGRRMSGGGIRITNNGSGQICDLSPNAVTWSSTCNCAVSGTWSGTCGGETAVLQINGCGTGTFESDAESIGVSFDRCYQL